MDTPLKDNPQRYAWSPLEHRDASQRHHLASLWPKQKGLAQTEWIGSGRMDWLKQNGLAQTEWIGWDGWGERRLSFSKADRLPLSGDDSTGLGTQQIRMGAIFS